MGDSQVHDGLMIEGSQVDHGLEEGSQVDHGLEEGSQVDNGLMEDSQVDNPAEVAFVEVSYWQAGFFFSSRWCINCFSCVLESSHSNV